MAIFVFVGILIIIMGITSFHPSTRDWFIRVGNSMWGTKTEITQTTILWAQISGVLMIIFGIGFIYAVVTTYK